MWILREGGKGENSELAQLCVGVHVCRSARYLQQSQRAETFKRQWGDALECIVAENPGWLWRKEGTLWINTQSLKASHQLTERLLFPQHCLFQGSPRTTLTQWDLGFSWVYISSCVIAAIIVKTYFIHSVYDMQPNLEWNELKTAKLMVIQIRLNEFIN